MTIHLFTKVQQLSLQGVLIVTCFLILHNLNIKGKCVVALIYKLRRMIRNFSYKKP